MSNTTKCISPIDGSVYVERKPLDLKSARDAARRAREAQPAWAARTLNERIRLVKKATAIIGKQKDRMALELAQKYGDGMRVNAIAPGFFIGNQNRALLTNEDGSFTERGHTIIKNTRMKRFGNADELNGAIHYLCSDASKFVTGVVIPIDGGFSAFSGV